MMHKFMERKIYDIPIKNPSILSNITAEIDEIMFAIPSISKTKNKFSRI